MLPSVRALVPKPVLGPPNPAQGCRDREGTFGQETVLKGTVHHLCCSSAEKSLFF